jgi:hypothetical protein
MFTHVPARRALLAVVVSFAAFSTAHAGDRAPLPGSFAAIQSVKAPGRYGPHLPAAEQPAQCAAPEPGATQALLAAKNPSRFAPHLAAADQPSRYETPRPGSPLALLAAKDPAQYGSRPAAGESAADIADASGVQASHCAVPANPAG